METREELIKAKIEAAMQEIEERIHRDRALLMMLTQILHGTIGVTAKRIRWPN